MYFLVEIEGGELLKHGCMITGLHIPNGQWSQQIRPVAVVEYLSSAIQVWEPKKENAVLKDGKTSVVFFGEGWETLFNLQKLVNAPDVPKYLDAVCKFGIKNSLTGVFELSWCHNFLDFGKNSDSLCQFWYQACQFGFSRQDVPLMSVFTLILLQASRFSPLM